jgi:hypothetical protein
MALSQPWEQGNNFVNLYVKKDRKWLENSLNIKEISRQRK